MKFVKLKVSELNGFLNSELYQNLDVKPISYLRVASYIKNPRGKESDYALYFYHIDTELIAFRSVFADNIFGGSKTIRFAWCSGTWVAEKHRRKNISKSLLKEVIKDWDNKLMATNFAEIIKPLYLSAGFNIFWQRPGFRYYLYTDFKKLLGERKAFKTIKPILPLFTSIAKLMSNYKVKKYVLNNNTKLVLTETIDADCKKLIQEQKDDALFQRGSDELNWLLKYPWISSENNTNILYPFSFDNIPNKTEIIKVYEDSKFVGFLIYSIVRNRMKILYHYFEQDNLNVLAKSVIQIAHQAKVAYLSVNEDGLVKHLNQNKKAFIYSKSFSLNILSTFNYDGDKALITYDGDGDNGFT